MTKTTNPTYRKESEGLRRDGDRLPLLNPPVVANLDDAAQVDHLLRVARRHADQGAVPSREDQIAMRSFVAMIDGEATAMKNMHALYISLLYPASIARYRARGDSRCTCGGTDGGAYDEGALLAAMERRYSESWMRSGDGTTDDTAAPDDTIGDVPDEQALAERLKAKLANAHRRSTTPDDEED